jgi:hypothetical protein
MADDASAITKNLAKKFATTASAGMIAKPHLNHGTGGICGGVPFSYRQMAAHTASPFNALVSEQS